MTTPASPTDKAPSAVTKEGITVRVGQVWRDLDKRTHRTVTVLEVHPEARPYPYVLVQGATKTRLRIARMHKHGQGFALVSEPQP